MFHVVKKRSNKPPSLRELIMLAIEKNKDEMKNNKRRKNKPAKDGVKDGSGGD